MYVWLSKDRFFVFVHTQIKVIIHFIIYIVEYRVQIFFVVLKVFYTKLWYEFVRFKTTIVRYFETGTIFPR